MINNQWLLKRRPAGTVSRDDFDFVSGGIPELDDGDVLVRVLYCGYDASQRIWLTDDGGYMAPIQIGEPMRCMGIGQVVESRDPGYAPGDIVEGFMSWQNYAVVRGDGPMPLRILPRADYPLTWNLGVFSVGGLTAYFGVVDGLKAGPGDTVLISAATGATGSLAGGIAKAMGAKKVIGTAGGADKCRWILETGMFDAAIDYTADFDARLREEAPEGVTAFFDSVGGDMLDSVLLQMAPHGRILICGAMSQGYTDVRLQGPANYMRIATHNLTVRGILLFYYRDRLAEGALQMAQWVSEGKLCVAEHVVEGLKKAPDLLPTLFTGKEPGKLILKIADPV